MGRNKSGMKVFSAAQTIANQVNGNLSWIAKSQKQRMRNKTRHTRTVRRGSGGLDETRTIESYGPRNGGIRWLGGCSTPNQRSHDSTPPLTLCARGSNDVVVKALQRIGEADDNDVNNDEGLNAPKN